MRDCVGAVDGEGVEGDADVAEAVEAVGADFLVGVEAAKLVCPVVWRGLDGDLRWGR